MSRPPIHIMQFYRQEPGDVSISDMAVFEQGDELEAVLGQALLGFFNSPTASAIQKPHHARAVAQDGSAVLTVMVIDAKTVERV